jgi:hypothetical protein
MGESGGKQTKFTLNSAICAGLHLSFVNPFGIHYHARCLD